MTGHRAQFSFILEHTTNKLTLREVVLLRYAVVIVHPGVILILICGDLRVYDGHDEVL